MHPQRTENLTVVTFHDACINTANIQQQQGKLPRMGAAGAQLLLMEIPNGQPGWKTVLLFTQLNSLNLTHIFTQMI